MAVLRCVAGLGLLRSGVLLEILAIGQHPAYQRNDYLGWIVRAKRADTRTRRIWRMPWKLEAGHRHMIMAYRARRHIKPS